MLPRLQLYYEKKERLAARDESRSSLSGTRRRALSLDALEVEDQRRSRAKSSNLLKSRCVLMTRLQRECLLPTYSLCQQGKRLHWARCHLHEASTGFQDVVWTDECTVQLETHRRFCCRKQGERPKNKPR